MTSRSWIQQSFAHLWLGCLPCTIGTTTCMEPTGIKMASDFCSWNIRYPTFRNPRESSGKLTKLCDCQLHFCNWIFAGQFWHMFDVQRCTGGAPNPRHLDFRFHTPDIQSLRTATQTLRAFNELRQPYAEKKPSVAPIGSLFNREYSEYITNGFLAPS